MLKYENCKTKSLLNVPGNLKMSEVADWAYIIRMMIWNDERLVKHQMTKLATSLNNLKTIKLENYKKLGGITNDR